MSDKQVTITIDTDLDDKALHHAICDALDASGLEWIRIESDPVEQE